jgi:hypothetical protein
MSEFNSIVEKLRHGVLMLGENVVKRDDGSSGYVMCDDSTVSRRGIQNGTSRELYCSDGLTEIWTDCRSITSHIA